MVGIFVGEHDDRVPKVATTNLHLQQGRGGNTKKNLLKLLVIKLTKNLIVGTELRLNEEGENEIPYLFECFLLLTLGVP